MTERPRIGEVRTTPNGSVGVAELLHDLSGNRTWNKICAGSDDANNQNIADTFCVQLGYSGAIGYTSVYVIDDDLLMNFGACINFKI